MTTILASLAWLGAYSALAGGLYTDAGGGVAFMSQTQEFFTQTGGPTPPNSLAMGLHLNFSLYGDLDGKGKGLLYHLGIQHRFSTKKNSGTSYNIHADYVGARVGWGDLYVGLAYSPFVVSKISSPTYTKGFGRVDSAWGALGEVGYLFPITPEAAFGLAGSAEWVSIPAGQSPAPILSGMAFLRVYLVGERAGVKRRERGQPGGPYEPWRYPRGYMKND